MERVDNGSNNYNNFLLSADRLLRVLNRGDCKSLALLNTIGKKKAKAIVDFRNMNGEFPDVSLRYHYPYRT